MRWSLFLVCLAVFNAAFTQKTDSANYFVKKEATPGIYHLHPIMDVTYFPWTAKRNKISNLNTFKDSISILFSLLEFEGDTSISSISPGRFPSSNPNRPVVLIADDSLYPNVTIEIIALFIFNRIIEHDEFYIASFPRLKAAKIGQFNPKNYFGYNDVRIPVIFNFYRKWLVQCEKMGAFDRRRYPLYKTAYCWL
jgi:hypothetical protein